MIRRAIIVSLVSLPVFAAGIPASTPEALEPFAPLVGPTWVAQFPNGELSDEQTFEWIYDGRFLRNEHRVLNQSGQSVYEGETIYAWDHTNETLVWWYWNTTGGYLTGTITTNADGWLAEGENHAPEGQTPRVRGELRNISADSWESVQYRDREGEWEKQWTMIYRPVSRQETSPSDRLFAVHFRPGPAWVADKPFREQKHAAEHSANLQRLRTEDEIAFGARYSDAGLIILRAGSEEEARAVIEADPAVAAGVFGVTIDPLFPFYPGCVD